MNPRPRFSIVICNYNYDKYVGAAIRSCLDQSYPRELFEIVVVDDGSTDDSRAVISEFAPERNLHVIVQDNAGQMAALAAGVAHASGDYVCLLDSDDLFLPNKLERLAEHLDSLAPIPEYFFLCHDEIVRNESSRDSESLSWFDLTTIRQLGNYLHLANSNSYFPFSTPCGQVLSIALARRLAAAIPSSDWRNGGADQIIGHSALLVAEGVHYLREPLSVYRIHGDNSQVTDGRFVPRPEARNRWPKCLAFLESFIDTLDLDHGERGERLAYLHRMARIVRSSSRLPRYVTPIATFVVLDDGEARHLGASLAAVLASTYSRTEFVLVTDDETRFRRLPGHLRGTDVRLVRVPRVQHSRAKWLRAGLASSRGDYIAFVRSGDRPDPVFMEQHVYVHRFCSLTGVTSSDIRIVDDAEVLLHVGVFSTAGLWRQPLQVFAPLSTALGEWRLAPLSANVIRRSTLFDRFMDLLDSCPNAQVNRMSAWLTLQFALATAGATRINECLLSYRVSESAAANYAALLCPQDDDEEPRSPNLSEAALFLSELYCRFLPQFEGGLAPNWHEQFGRWVRAELSAADLATLAAIVGRNGVASLFCGTSA